MPETILNNNFSAGWVPSDDQVNGRPNGLLMMDNVELDRNGALQLVGGTELLYGAFPSYAHTLFSRFINGVRADYLALANSTVYRGNTQIVSGGDSQIAAFGTAFNYTLICSGSQRFKDDGTILTNLGVKPPTVAPTITQDTTYGPFGNVGNYFTDYVQPTGSASTVVGGNYLQVTTSPDGIFVMQTYPPPSPGALDLSRLGGVTGYGMATDDDYLMINGYTPNPFGVSLQFDILLKPGNAAGDQVTDFYTHTVQDLAVNATFDAISGVFTLRIPRTDFARAGGGAFDWSKTYGFRITINANRKEATVINLWSTEFGNNNFVLRGGSHALFGTYQWVQVNVNNNGSYLAKSVAGPASVPVVVDGQSVLVNFQNPTAIDPQVNEVWLFRNGGNLGGTYYRVAVVKGPSFPSGQYDPLGDQEALDLNITLNINLISTADIPEKIMDIIGPIQGRWYYFTTNFMYPSDVNDPDLVNPSIAVRTCGSSSELFMWARAVSASVVIIGTSVDCYLLTGTFSNFPDGSIDIYYQSLGVKFPPISYDATAYGGAVYYFASDGWRLLLPTSFGSTYSSQNNQLIVAPNTDRIYKGETCYGYPPPAKSPSPGAVRYPVTVGRNRLWCTITGTSRYEVYDFMRQHWRVVKYGLNDITAITTTQDGLVLGFFQGDFRLRVLESHNTKLVDNSGKQVFRLLFTFRDGGMPRQRKDTYTFKSRCYTGGQTGDFMQLQITDEKGSTLTLPQQLSSPVGSTEIFEDLSSTFKTGQGFPNPVIPKAYQVYIFGAASNFYLEDWSIDFDPRPVPLTFLKLYPSNLGSATQKRVRTWPLIIDTLGNNVVFTPEVDGVQQAASTFNTTYKKTVFHYFVTDVFGIDYGGTLYDSTGLMEVWSTGLENQSGLAGDVVQNLPMSHKYDQVGPIEIFRFGKIVRMALRTQSNGTPIPFKVFIGDTNIYSGNFDVKTGVEDEYIVDLPKGASGSVLRVELGPTNFTFSRYFMKFQVMISGGQQDTELAWITVPGVSQMMAQGI